MKVCIPPIWPWKWQRELAFDCFEKAPYAVANLKLALKCSNSFRRVLKT